MHKAVVGREVMRQPCRDRAAQCWLFAGLLLGTSAAFAADPSDWTSDTTSLSTAPLAQFSGRAATTPSASVIEISASRLPRFDSFDGAARIQQRVDMALLSPGRSAFGVTMGVTGLSPARYGLAGAAPDAAGNVNLGLQWRYVLENNRRIDITAWRDISRPSDALSLAQARDPGYGARVEMQLAGASSRFVADHGFVGMQLDGGGRIALKRSGGKPLIYYRNKF